MLSRQKRSAGQEVHVLDIGTGTGLLSMMAVRLGADSVVACEEFRPMAECAERVMRENGYWDRIKLGWCLSVSTLQSLYDNIIKSISK